MAKQVREAEDVIRELRAELVAAHEDLAALKAGIYPEAPFRA